MLLRLILVLACVVIVSSTSLKSTRGATDRVVCYFPNWGRNVTGFGEFTVSNIDPALCTHIIFAFAYIDGTQLVTTDPLDFLTYQQLNNLKADYPSLKTLLAVGGYEMGAGPWEHVVENQGKLNQFSRNVAEYITTHGFDGVDIDWEYPTSDTKDSFTELLKSIREELDRTTDRIGGNQLLLTTALAATIDKISNSYDLREIHKHVDFANIMTYDYWGYWGFPTTADFHSALYGETYQHQYSQNYTLHQYLIRRFPRDKFVLGIPTYGRSFTLCDPVENRPGDAACGPGNAGHYSQEPGILAYFEICLRLIHAEYTRVYNYTRQVPYAYRGDQWVGYDDVQSATAKIEFAHEEGLGGVMFWDLSKDDFYDFCQGGEYPIIRLATQYTTPPPTTTTTTRQTWPTTTTTTRQTRPTTTTTTRQTWPTTTTTTRRTRPTTTTTTRIWPTTTTTERTTRTRPTTTTTERTTRTRPTTTTTERTTRTRPTTTTTERTTRTRPTTTTTERTPRTRPTTTTTTARPTRPTTTTTTEKTPVQCTEDVPYIRDHDDCAVFCQCVAGEPICQACAGDLVFDTCIDACNYPMYVDCSANPVC